MNEEIDETLYIIDFYYIYSANMNWQAWLYESKNKISLWE